MAEISGIEFEVKGNADNAAKSLDKLAESLSRIKSIGNLGIKNISSEISKIGNNNKTSRFLDGLADKILKLTTVPWKAATYPIKSSIKSIKEYASKLGTVASSFKRILGYRLIRTLIKEIGKAFQEGTQNLYQWSKTIGGSFAANMDSATASMLYFKNSIGAAWSPLMNLLAPALDAIIDKVVAVINVINQLIALLSGQSYWTRATKQATEYGNAVGGAGGAAKEALKYLAPFDELNVLPDKSSGGGGGGGDDDIGFGTFEEVSTFDSQIASFVQSIRDAIANADWQGLGTILGDAINGIVDKIDFASIGTKVGEKINALFTTEYWTLKTINFQNIGAKVAEFFNNALANIDFKNVGGTIAQKMTILPDLFIGAINKLDFATVGKSIGDTIKGFFTNIGEWAAGVDWGQFAYNLVSGLEDLLKGLDVAGIVKAGLVMMANVGKGIADGLAGALGAVVDSITSFFSADGTWTKIKNAIATKWNELVDSWGLASDWKLPITVEPDVTTDNAATAMDKVKKALEDASKTNPAAVSTTAQLRSYENKLKNPKINTTANFNASKNKLTGNKKPTINSTAGINAYNVARGLLVAGRLGINSVAKIIKADTAGKTYDIPVRGILTTVQQKDNSKKAGGGVFSGGKWNPIERFASGGLARGSQLFWARESGPELVGTLGGHTAVMNNDQIVASVSAGVARAISSIQFHLAGFASASPVETDGGVGDEAMYRAFRRALDETDFGGDIELDGDVLYRKMVRRNRANTRMTGVNAMA